MFREVFVLESKSDIRILPHEQYAVIREIPFSDDMLMYMMSSVMIRQ